MDSAEEAREYDLMDHVTVNAAFVTDLLDAMVRLGRSDLRGRFVIDVGTGTARIPDRALPRRSRRAVSWPSILRTRCCVWARENVLSAGLAARVALQLARVTALPFRDGLFARCDVEQPDPSPAGSGRAPLSSSSRIVSPGGIVFVRDLFRPASRSSDRSARGHVHAAGATTASTPAPCRLAAGGAHAGRSARSHQGIALRSGFIDGDLGSSLDPRRCPGRMRHRARSDRRLLDR